MLLGLVDPGAVGDRGAWGRPAEPAGVGAVGGIEDVLTSGSDGFGSARSGRRRVARPIPERPGWWL